MFGILNIVIPFIVGLCILSVPVFVVAGGILFLIASEKDVVREGEVEETGVVDTGNPACHYLSACYSGGSLANYS
ncbi:MAG: hypothetical protein EXS51_03970 [Candidatus Taylorbacteria bacterium]|nr:hypothetical protein [Candidatus Taylorbacteria bacterium]